MVRGGGAKRRVRPTTRIGEAGDWLGIGEQQHEGVDTEIMHI